jgi:hypothetical protein
MVSGEDCKSFATGLVCSSQTVSTKFMIQITEWIKESRDIRTSHLDLSQPCIERGGNSTNHRGVLAQYLNTNFPKGIGIDLCHACNNGECSNPQHLYWGTRKENVADARLNGTHKSPFENVVAKYGYEEACNINKLNGKM